MATRRRKSVKRSRSVRRTRHVARRKSGVRKAPRRSAGGGGRTLRIVIEHQGVDNAARPELAAPRQTHVRTAKF